MIVYFQDVIFSSGIYWLATVVPGSAESCEVCNNVDHKTDTGHVSMTSQLTASLGKLDDKKLVKSVNRGNCITFVARHKTVSPILIPKKHLRNIIHYKINYKAHVCQYHTVPAQLAAT